MPEYGNPIYNNLHWKSTLDFFKERDEAGKFFDDAAEDPDLPGSHAKDKAKLL